jgi:hypothetical protein
MTLMNYCVALIMVPSSQQHRVTVLQKLSYSLSIGLLFQVEAIAPSLVTESKDPNDNEAGMTPGDDKHKFKDVIKDMLQLPVSKTRCRMTRNNPSTKVFSLSRQTKQLIPSTTIIKSEKRTQNNDDACGLCGGFIRMMLRKKLHEWIECTFCQVWYHTTCQKVVGEYHFLCDGCEDSNDSE